MEQQKIPPPTPEDATKASDEQRQLQDDLDRRNDQPDALGQHQTRHDMADET